jgi:peptidyl-prolyl cis-trans isomerase C
MNHPLREFLLLGVFLCIALNYGCQQDKPPAGDESEPVSGDPTMVVASVGEEKILLEEVDNIVRVWKMTNFPGTKEMTEREMQTRALDNLIEQELLLQASQENNLLPTEEQVDQVVGQLIAKYPTREDWVKSVEMQGMNEAEFRQNVFNDMAVRQYIGRTIPDTVSVSSDDARSYYDAHPDLFEVGERLHARHILIKARGIDTAVTPEEQEEVGHEREDAHRKADSLYMMLQEGAVFDELAREQSDCPSASRGGDLGEFGRGDMVAAFEEAAYRLQPGELSEPVETRFGYHIIQLEEKVASRLMPFDTQLESRVMQQLRMDRFSEVVRARVEELKGQTPVDRKL